MSDAASVRLAITKELQQLEEAVVTVGELLERLQKVGGTSDTLEAWQAKVEVALGDISTRCASNAAAITDLAARVATLEKLVGVVPVPTLGG